MLRRDLKLARATPRNETPVEDTKLEVLSETLKAVSADVPQTAVPADDVWTSEEETVAVRKHEAELSARQVKRQRVMARDPRRGHGSYLEQHSVTKATWEKYTHMLDEWINLCELRGLDLVSDKEIDDAVADWMNEQFRLGHMPWKGDVLLAAVLAKFPEFGRMGSRRLPRAGRCLVGWRRLCPKHSRVPYPWPVWCLIAAELAKDGFFLMSVAVLLMVDAYLRPSELLSLRRSSLLPPAPWTGRAWSILLFPEKELPRSKTGESDDTIMLNSARTMWMDAVWRTLAAGKPDELLFPFGYGPFFKMLTATGRRHGLDLVPYQGRHSGISIDRAENARSHMEAMKRGRWRSERSVRRYEKAGRLNDVWTRLPANTKASAEKAERRIKSVILHGSSGRS